MLRLSSINLFCYLLGKIVRSAYALKRKVFIYVATDGANFSLNSLSPEVPWDGDTSDTMLMFLAYDPNGPMSKKDNKLIGAYNNAQAVDQNPAINPFSNSTKACATVVANYLSFSNMSSSIDLILKGSLSQAEKDVGIKILPLAPVPPPAPQPTP